MDTYYRDNYSKRSATLWAARLIKYNLEATRSIWTERNNQLHNTIRIQELEGVPTLKKAIKDEWDIGLGRLPASEFSKYFKTKLPILLQKETEHLKHWFLVIRQARVLMDPTNVLEDEFSTSKALQSWVGLSLKVTNTEGAAILHEAIKQETQIGIGNLPIQYAQDFTLTEIQILKQTIDWKKKWFCKIKEARIQYNNANVLCNEFAYPRALRDWVEEF